MIYVLTVIVNGFSLFQRLMVSSSRDLRFHSPMIVVLSNPITGYAGSLQISFLLSLT